MKLSSEENPAGKRMSEGIVANNIKCIAKTGYETHLTHPGLTKIADMLRGEIDDNRSRSVQR
jgi:hypothetical protein